MLAWFASKGINGTSLGTFGRLREQTETRTVLATSGASVTLNLQQAWLRLHTRAVEH